jgi:uncharacterized membrane protein
LIVLFFAAVLWLILSSTHHHNHWRGRPPYPYGDGGGHPHPHPHGGASSEAMTILDRRFANGEIDEDEYLRRRKLLGGES